MVWIHVSTLSNLKADPVYLSTQFKTRSMCFLGTCVKFRELVEGCKFNTKLSRYTSRGVKPLAAETTTLIGVQIFLRYLACLFAPGLKEHASDHANRAWMLAQISIRLNQTRPYMVYPMSWITFILIDNLYLFLIIFVCVSGSKNEWERHGGVQDRK
jgi:hypothetical protein